MIALKRYVRTRFTERQLERFTSLAFAFWLGWAIASAFFFGLSS